MLLELALDMELAFDIRVRSAALGGVEVLCSHDAGGEIKLPTLDGLADAVIARGLQNLPEQVC